MLLATLLLGLAGCAVEAAAPFPSQAHNLLKLLENAAGKSVLWSCNDLFPDRTEPHNIMVRPALIQASPTGRIHTLVLPTPSSLPIKCGDGILNIPDYLILEKDSDYYVFLVEVKESYPSDRGRTLVGLSQ